MISIRKILNRSYDSKIIKINNSSFDEIERIDINKMFLNGYKNEVLGIFKDEILVGFMLNIVNETHVYMILLAIACEYRMQGIGSIALNQAINYYNGKEIIVDIEIPDGSNNLFASKRKQFYLRNGFKETGKKIIFKGQKFELLSTKSLNDCSNIIILLNKYISDYNEKICI